MTERSIYRLLQDVARANPDRAAYRLKRDGAWVDVSWSETAERVAAVSRALVAAGVAPGDRVAILSGTRLEWTLVDFGTVCSGGVTVGIYPSNLADDCAYVLEHCDAGIVFVEDAGQLEKILAVRARLPLLRRIVIFGGPSDPQQGVESFADFLASGAATPEDELRRRGEALGPDDLASLVYTSGTTGVPKGVMLTHGNLLFASYSATQCLDLQPHYCTLLFLPLAHVFARLVIYFSMRKPLTVAFAEEIGKVGENLKEIRPHFIASVPRVYEKVYDRVVNTAEDAGGLKAALFHWALDVGYAASRLRQNGDRPSPWLALRHALASRLVFRKIQAGLGGRLLYAISGAAPLNKAIAEFFDACGIPILEGIGMTENSSFSNVNRIEHNKFGTVGPVGPGIEMKIAPDGEVLFRGQNVMKGYFKNPEATAEAIDGDGWLHSGDIGEIDAEGFLRITDRKKDLIVTAGGKNVAPQRIERILRTSRYIAQAMAYGDRRKYVTAIVTLDGEAVGAWARQKGLAAEGPELASLPEVRELIAAEVHRLNAQLASFESVKRFHIAPREFGIETGELTPTQKIRRKVVAERYREAIEALYA